MRTVDERHVSIRTKRCLCTQKAFEPQPAQHSFMESMTGSLKKWCGLLRLENWPTVKQTLKSDSKQDKLSVIIPSSACAFPERHEFPLQNPWFRQA